MIQRLRKIILSDKFLPFVFAFFVLQALFYAWYIGFGIPSDETYHFGASKYYAQQSITTGPFTHGQDPATIHTVRAIDRDANYFGHYLLSFPLRMTQALHASMRTEVLVLRFIDIIFAVASLYVLKRCLDEISNDKLVKNAALFAMSMTGMAVWIAGAVSYDNLANLLFLLFVWSCLRFIKRPDTTKALLILSLAAATVITKYSFIAVIALGVVTMFFFAWKARFTPAVFWQQLRKNLKLKPALAISVIGFFLLSAGLFIERDGMNLVRYHTIRPSCTSFFSEDQCRTYNVFNRNYNQRIRYSDAAKNDLIFKFEPTTFAGEWIYTMYNTLYFQLGDRRFESTVATRIVASILLGAIVVTAFFSRQRMRLSKGAIFALGLSSFYVLSLFLYNLKTLIHIGQKYAYQGRYLIPVLGFVYFFFILMAVTTYRNRRPASKKPFAYAWLAILLLFFAVHFPPLLLARHTDPSWRETYVLPPEVVD